MINNLFKNTSLLLVSQVVIMLTGLVIQIVMARLLMPEGRGLYALCIVYSSIIVLLTNFGNEFGIRFLLLKKKLNLSESFLFLIITAAISVIISVLILSLFGDFLQTKVLTKVSTYQILLALFFTITTLISKQINVLLTISKEFKKAAFISFFEEVLKLLLLFLLLRQFQTVETALISVIIANTVIILFYMIRFKLYVLSFKNINFFNLKFIYNYGLKSFFMSFSNLANNHLGIIILSIYLSNEKIGVYSVAFGLISRFQFIPDTLNRVFVPLSNENQKEGTDSLKLFSSFLFYLFMAIVIFLFIFGDYIVTLLFGNDYREAGLLLKILSVGFVFKMLSKPIEAYYNEVKGKPVIISIINIFTLILLSVFMLIMSKNYGLIGASIASSFTMILAFTALFISFLIIERESASGFFDFRNLLHQFKILFKIKK